MLSKDSCTKLQSKPELNLLMSIGVLLMGVPLIWLGRNYSGYGDNLFAAFALGCLLLILGLLTLVMGETRSVELDQNTGASPSL